MHSCQHTKHSFGRLMEIVNLQQFWRKVGEKILYVASLKLCYSCRVKRDVLHQLIL